jgi:hypothetical protein
MNNNNNLVLEILNNINNIYRDLETEYFYYVNEINNNKVNLTGINGSNLTLDLNNLFIKKENNIIYLTDNNELDITIYELKRNI